MITVANIEKLENTEFIVINVYGNRGYLVDQLIDLYDPNKVPELFRRLINEHRETLECLTSNRELYGMTLTMPGVGGVLKHRDDTKETASSLRDAEDILRDIYDIEPLVPKPKLPAWRKRFLLWLEKLSELVGGNGKYEV